MEKVLINDFVEFLKQKYNIIFLFLVVYIVRIEIDYGYITHLTFDSFFMNNPVITYILTIIQPSNLKLIEIFFKFNITFIVSYLLFYTKISPPHDLREFLVIKRNFYIYPIIFIYVLIAVLIYNLLIYTTTNARFFKPMVDFLQAFIAIEFGFYIIFNYPLTRYIDKRWTNFKTFKEYSLWNEKKFQPKYFVEGVSAGFKDEETYKKAKELGLVFPSQLQYYGDMVKGNFPSFNDFYEASSHNVTNYGEWINVRDQLKASKNKTDLRIKNNIFDILDYFIFTLKSKYNIFFILILLSSVVDYYLTINGFYNNTDYITKLTMINFVNRWIFFYSLIFVSYFIFFSVQKNPKRGVDVIYYKINSFVYPIIFLLVTNFRLEIFTAGKPQLYMTITTRILQNVMQPFLGASIAVFFVFLPLIVISILTMDGVDKNKYEEFLDGNFISYSGYKKTKKLSVNFNLDYAYLLENQNYLKGSQIKSSSKFA